MAFVALLLCSCRRWDRVTTRLIAAIEPSGVLCDSDLDELAESLLSHELVISYPLTWISPQWLDIDLSAARRALRADPTRLDDLLSAAEGFQPRHRDALIHGLLDAADVLDEVQRRGVVRRGLQTAQASVRRTAGAQVATPEPAGPRPLPGMTSHESPIGRAPAVARAAHGL